MNSDDKKDPIIVERVARLEVIAENHEKSLERLKNDLSEIKTALSDITATQVNYQKSLERLSDVINEIKTTLNNITITQKGLNFFLKNIALPIILAVITAIILRII